MAKETILSLEAEVTGSLRDVPEGNGYSVDRNTVYIESVWKNRPKKLSAQKKWTALNNFFNTL